jgi:hypothetical protein
MNVSVTDCGKCTRIQSTFISVAHELALFLLYLHFVTLQYSEFFYTVYQLALLSIS